MEAETRDFAPDQETAIVDPTDRKVEAPSEAEQPEPTLSEVLATLIGPRADGCLPISAWGTLRWRRWSQSPAGYAIELPSGSRVLIGRRQYDALAHVVRWTMGQTGARPGDDDAMLAVGLAGRPEYIGRPWIRAVVDAGGVTFAAYLNVRQQFEADIAGGASERVAWSRARSALRGVRELRPSASIPLGVPRELAPAVEHLGERLGLLPSTTRNYQLVLAKILERVDGELPTGPALERLLDATARRYTYCSAARTVWRALAKSAAVDGIVVPVPSRRRARR